MASPVHVNLRPEVARHLRQRLQAFADGFRHNLALIGPPGSGKSFQLQQLAADHPSNLTVLYCPLYRESCRTLLQRLLGTVLRAAQPETACPQTIEALRSVEGLLTRRLYSDAFNRILDAIPVLIKERGQLVVLILDEFLCLEEVGLGHAFHELGKRVMTVPGMLFVLSSSSPYRAREILRERLQLLFGQFELLNVAGLNPQSVTGWAQQELRGARGGHAVSPFLIQWLGTSPWYVTVFLKRFKELGTLRKTAAVTETLFFQTAWDLLGAAEGTLHQWCVSRTEGVARSASGTRAIDALIEMAAGARTTTELGRRIGRAGLPGALQMLVEHDLAQRNGMCWTVSDPVLRCWLSTILAAQRAESPAGPAEVRERFERYLQSLWTEWLHANRLTFPEQVAGLFAKFTDDIVAIDSKTGRLPKFRTIIRSPSDGSPGKTYLVADDGQGKRWCVTIQEGAVDENTIARFDAFCRRQLPKPTRKVVIAKSAIDQNAKLLAKTVNMWVWGAEDIQELMGLYGHPAPLNAR